MTNVDDASGCDVEVRGNLRSAPDFIVRRAADGSSTSMPGLSSTPKSGGSGKYERFDVKHTH